MKFQYFYLLVKWSNKGASKAHLLVYLTSKVKAWYIRLYAIYLSFLQGEQKTIRIRSQWACTINRQKGQQGMDNSKLLDALSDIAELNRLNGIAPEGQEGQLLMAAGLLAVADAINDLTTAFKYSGTSTGHLSIGESMDIIADAIKGGGASV